MSHRPVIKILFTFNHAHEHKHWRPIDDSVMGGVSQSRWRITEDGVAIFSGTVSLENNGGFASIRSTPREMNLDGYRGIVIRAKGDGQAYKLNLKNDTGFEGILYQQRFATRGREWEVIHLPFEGFDPKFRGRELSEAPPLDVRKIQTFGFMISDKQTGPFTLEIDWIQAYQQIENHGE